MFFLSKIRSRFAAASLAASAVALGLGAAAPAVAADLPSRIVTPVAPDPGWGFAFFTRIGASGVFSDAHVSSYTNLAAVGGPSGLYSSNIGSNGNVAALYVESGVYVTPNIAISIAGGYPPTITTTGKGVLAGAGALASAVVGFPTIEATYHLTNFGPFRPYLGGGVGYAIVFHDSGAFLQYPNLKDHVGYVITGGADYDLSAHWSLFVDVKKVFLTQTLTALTPAPPAPGVYPTVSSLRTDPIIVSAGVGYRF